MPVYEYICQSCEKQFEKLVKSMTSGAKIPCPECGSMKTARTLSVFAVADSSKSSSSGGAPTCGRCGGAPGSCSMQ